MIDRFVHNYAVTPEAALEEQIQIVSNSKAYHDCDIAIMADSHVGASGPIGFVCQAQDRVIPATVGVDVGCRVSLFAIGINIKDVDEEFFKKFDKMVEERIPTGFHVRTEEHEFSKAFPYEKLKCLDSLKNLGRVRKSLGTLGGGNHYLELDQDETGDLYLSIHCGSRNLGKQVAEYYQNLAIKRREERIALFKECYEEEIYEAKSKGEFHRIEDIKKKYQTRINNEPVKDLCYISCADLKDYVYDMQLCNRWSLDNHRAIFEEIKNGLQEILDDSL